MVRLIRSAMNVDVRLKIGWVKTGGPDAPAWIQMPVDMPFYGTPSFRALTLTMFIRLAFVECSSCEQMAAAIAHELSHVVLDSLQHPLRREEKAVDLTAMLLGFSYVYLLAAHTERRVGNTITRHQLGYLSKRELTAAARTLIPTADRAALCMLRVAKQFIPLLALVGVILFGAGGLYVCERLPAILHGFIVPVQ